MSDYIDISAVVQVIGAIYTNPKILDAEDKYHFVEYDFPSEFHKIVFGSIFNLHQLGVKEINLGAIADYLDQRPKKLAIYKVNKGDEYLLRCAEEYKPAAFDYYYQRLKKMTLLRGYKNAGMDVSFIYDEDNIFDAKKKQEQEDWLDNASLEDIANKINDRIDAVKMEFTDGVGDDGCQIAEGIDEFLEGLKETPALGYPLYGQYINRVTRGARLGKFFLRSAATGIGKTRSMIADACFIGCSQMYDIATQKWISIGAPQPTLFIATEQDINECQSMALAFLSGVDEEHILENQYFAGEIERIVKASQILKQSKIYFECIPDFGLQDIENLIKKHMREHQVLYNFFDYIHTSTKMLTEIGGRSGIKNLREDNLLFLLSTKLKDICVQYGVFIMSSTQLNASYLDSETPDQNLLRGSKAIADRLDWGSIMMEVTKEDMEKITPICTKNNIPKPNVKLSIYKCRQGRYRAMYLWMVADKSCCRFNPVFATDWNYTAMDLEDLKIRVEEESAF